MKRFISILLAICILFANTGWALTAHYCMGERVSLNVRHAGLPDMGQHECSKCGMVKTTSDNGCCHDEDVLIKGAQDAVSAIVYFQFSVDATDLQIPGFTFPNESLAVNAEQQSHFFQPHGPPGFNGPPLFIRHCVFLI